MKMLLEKLPGICSEDEVQYVDAYSDWSMVVLQYSFKKALTEMDNQTWEECPITTNAVERRNQDCSVNKPFSHDGGIQT